MVLFYQIVKTLDWPQLAASWQSTLALELVDGLGVGAIAIYIDHARCDGVLGTQGFPEETLC